MRLISAPFNAMMLELHYKFKYLISSYITLNHTNMAALLDLRMPGVYTQEVPTLPPTVGVIQSAVPVFIGYTEKASWKGESLSGKPTRIKSMKEYEERFGGAKKVEIEVIVDNRQALPIRPEVLVDKVTTLKHKMHYALKLYYANGGGPCFILSVGDYSGDPNEEELGADAVFKVLQKAKDVTILLFPDGSSLSLNAYKSVIEKALLHCEKMKNRVTVIDVHGGDKSEPEITADAEAFQSAMPNDLNFKKYGMAYFPFLESGLAYQYDASKVTISDHLDDSTPKLKTATANILAKKAAVEVANQAVVTATAVKAFLEKMKEKFTAGTPFSAEDKEQLPVAVQTAIDTSGDVVGALDTAITGANSDITAKDGDLATATTALTNTKQDGVTAGLLIGKKMDSIINTNNKVYSQIQQAIRAFPVSMPPSPAIAGIYVRTDATQGVWKAPANVSVFGVVQPTIELDDDDHAELNAPDNGKSINAIRAYPGRGILVYGGRTLAGNDLEWRYVNVRRTFCFIEDSVARAMQDFVFAINTQETWIKVKAMIESFLLRLWKAGGLYGNTPQDAFEVIVGEPDSMSVEEVLSGIMRVIIKVAVARPAEFIILQYEHKFELTEG